MNKDRAIIEAARKAEATASSIRNLMVTYYTNKDVKSVQVLRFAGSFCSMASSILCELYETQDSDFDIVNANNVLREWGVDELVD